MKPNEMTIDELIYALDQRYGNPLSNDCELIQEAIEMLRFMNDEIKALHGDIEDLQET